MITLINREPIDVSHPAPFVRLGPFSKLLKCDVEGNTVLGENSCFNRCRIGRYSGMGCFSYVADAVIGKFCTFASRVSVGAFNHPTDWLSVHEFQYRDIKDIYGDSILEGGVNLLNSGYERPTKIGNDVWIGDNASVARGISIGDGVIVGMSSVVTRDVPPYSIVVGNPGRVLRFRYPEAIVRELLEIRWWDMDLQSLKGVDFAHIERAVEELKKRKQG
jgi:acetyltransferase-like isoleucine patch superfamily enzyme